MTSLILRRITSSNKIYPMVDNQCKMLKDLSDKAEPLNNSSLHLDHREAPQSKQGGYSMHQLQGNREFGCEKTGYLLKRSGWLWKTWQRRQCSVKGGHLTISHVSSNRQPVKISLLTCQVKPSPKDGKRFDLVSPTRTYHFQAEDEQESVIWISVLINTKEEELKRMFCVDQRSSSEDGLDDPTQAMKEEVLGMPGNEVCCDCGAADPKWLSTNT